MSILIETETYVYDFSKAAPICLRHIMSKNLPIVLTLKFISITSDTLVGSDLVRPTLMGQPGQPGLQSNGVDVAAVDQLATVSLASPPPSFPKNAHVF